MKKLLSVLALSGMMLSALTTQSCQKLVDDATETTESAEDAASDQAAVSSLSDVVMDLVTSNPNMQKNGNPLLPPGSYITYMDDDSVFTDGDGIHISFEIGDPAFQDFVNDPVGGVVCTDGETRWGSGFIEITAPYDDPSCEVYLELNRYFTMVNGQLVHIDDGATRRTKKNKQGKAKELILVRTSSTSFDLDYNFSVSIRELGEVDYEKTYTTGTLNIDITDGGQEGMLDDIMTLSGTIEGDNRNEDNYIVTITKPLVRKLAVGCSNTFVEGTMELKNDGSKFEVKSDFGDGTCDNLVEVTLPGNVKKTITVQ